MCIGTPMRHEESVSYQGMGSFSPGPRMARPSQLPVLLFRLTSFLFLFVGPPIAPHRYGFWTSKLSRPSVPFVQSSSVNSIARSSSSGRCWRWVKPTAETRIWISSVSIRVHLWLRPTPNYPVVSTNPSRRRCNHHRDRLSMCCSRGMDPSCRGELGDR